MRFFICCWFALAPALAAQDTVPRSQHPSTGGERMMLGLLVGAAPLAATWLAVQDAGGDLSPAAQLAIYSGGVYLGVLLATRARRDGMRPVATLAGTALGALGAALIYKGLCPGGGDTPEGCEPGVGFVAVPLMLFSVPLGGSLGFRLGRS